MSEVDVKIVTIRKPYLKWSFTKTFETDKKIRNGAIAIEKEKSKINLNKSTYIGTSILDLNKILMQGLH